MDKNRISYLLQKLRSNQATTEERNELESFWQWAQSDQSVVDALPDENRESIKNEIFEGIRNEISDLESSQKKQRYLYPSKWMLKIAASIAFVVVLSWWLYPDDKLSFQTGYGEHLSLTLPDSSRVILNANSLLRYNDAWNHENDREVWIEGEAFFDVTHSVNDQKFLVHTKAGVDVQVLGTRFNVKIRRGKTEVMLEEGRVRLDVSSIFSGESAILKPGDLGMLSNDEFIVGTVSPSQYSAWKENRLYFNETTLQEVAYILGDTYGMEVLFEDEKLAARKLSGQIDARDANDILMAIAESFNISVSDEGRRVIFHSNN